MKCLCRDSAALMTLNQVTVSVKTHHPTPANLLKPLSYLQTLLRSSLKLRFLEEENIHESQGTFCRSSCSFFSMASSCDTFSSRFPGESLQPRHTHKRSDTIAVFSPFQIETSKRPQKSCLHFPYSVIFFF